MQAAGSSLSSTGNLDLEKHTILLVDDDADVREGLGELLESEGYDVVTAVDGMDALDQLRRGLRPSAILLDLMMPKMNGWDFRQEQRSDDDLKDIPVVVITAAGLSEAAVKAQLGNVEFMTKPAPEKELMDTLRRCCTGTGSSAAT